MDACPDFTQILATQGVRPTRVRQAILATLHESARALNAGELCEAIRLQHRVNKVTVYRILEDFTRRGLLRRLLFEGRTCYFEIACDHNPVHPHFQCQQCGQIQCLEPIDLGEIWKEVKGPVGNLATTIEIRVAGICRRCRGL